MAVGRVRAAYAACASASPSVGEGWWTACACARGRDWACDLAGMGIIMFQLAERVTRLTGAGRHETISLSGAATRLSDAAAWSGFFVAGRSLAWR